MAAQKASRTWSRAGKPRNEENDLFRNKKETNTILRKAIKTFNNEKETDENNKMINANF